MLTEPVDRLLAGCADILSGREDDIARFKRLIRFFMEIYAVSRDKHAVMLTCLEFLPPNVRKDVVKKQRQLIQIVTDVLAKIRPDRGKDESSAHIDSMLFFGMINWTYKWFRPDGRVLPTELADRAVSLFLDGYVKSKIFLNAHRRPLSSRLPTKHRLLEHRPSATRVSFPATPSNTKA